MKRNRYHIIHTWLLLICFIAGQYMVFAHQHIVNNGSNKSACHSAGSQPKQTLKENCQLCDAMHHNTMATAGQVYFTPAVVTNYTYKVVKHNFITVSIILSAGRSPPMAS